MRPVGRGGHHRPACVRGLPDRHRKRHFAEKRRADPCGFVTGAAVTEDIVPTAAIGADEVAHVLDDAEHRHADLVEHVEPLAGIDQRQILRRRHDHRAGQRHILRHRQLCVAGAGRHVDDQHVELAPCHFAQHLVERRHHHRAAPDHRRVFFHQEAHRHDLQAVILHRLEHPAFKLFGTAGDAQKPRHRRSIDIGVQNTDLETGRLKPERQIDRGRRLADAALARGNGDDGGNTRNTGLGASLQLAGLRRRVRVGRALLRRRRWRGRTGPSLAAGGQRHHRTLDAGNGLGGAFGGFAQRFEFLRARGRNGEREIDLRIGDEDFRHHAEIHNIAFEIRSLDRSQFRQNLFFGHAHLALHGFVVADHPHIMRMALQ